MAPTWPLPGDAGRFRDQWHDNYSTLGFSLLWPFSKQNRREKVSEEKTAGRGINRCTNGGGKGEKRTKKEH